MANIREEYLQQYCDELSPLEFYREVFPEGELQRADESGNWKGNALAVELLPKGKGRSVKRYTIGDDLRMVEELLEHENFILISPIGYVGKSREAKNARYIYALAIDLDGVETEGNMRDLFYQMDGNGPSDYLPKPTSIVSSGNGLHIYYVFQEPIPCFKNIVEQMSKLKHEITRKLWNGFVTRYEDNVQYQSIFQGFRMVGGVTKNGGRVRAFRVGDKVTLEYLNGFVAEEHQVTGFAYKSKLTKAKAKEKFPEWYERRIEKGQPKNSWTCNRAVYEWWKRKIEEQIVAGHRYYGVMCLAVYAKKCGIPKKELEKDAFSMVDMLEGRTTEEGNHFTREDVLCALEMYNDDYITFPIETISKLTDVRIERNKRNGRKQATHLRIARSTLAIMNEDEGKALQGRPDKKKTVTMWRAQNPNGTKAECIRATGFDKKTVYKWWNEKLEIETWNIDKNEPRR